jgi:DNA-binding MarR family transcriptional regulator
MTTKLKHCELSSQPEEGYTSFMNDGPLTPRDLEIWHAFKRMGQHAMAGIERDIMDATKLSGADFGVLSRLVDLGDGELRQQALADSMGWHKSRLSHQLTRMQERSLVERRETDGRVVTVSITEEGRRKIDGARPIHAASVRRRLLGRLTPLQTEALIEISAAVLK